MAPNLPASATPLAWWEERGATLGLCVIEGVPLIHGLTSNGVDSLAVARLYKRALRIAKEHGFENIYLEASNPDVIKTASRVGFKSVSIIMELNNG